MDNISNNIKENICRTVNIFKSAVNKFNPGMNLKIRRFDSPAKQVFFGYYDITPFSPDNSLLLAMQAPLENVSPKSESEVTVGYYDIKKEPSAFVAAGNTTTWCWQQGCRLQWYPENSSSTILYNRLVEGEYGSVVFDIQKKEITKSYKKPLYTVSWDGRWGLALNFSRLQRMRPGYGYVNFRDETQGQPAPADDGIWRIDMKTGDEHFLFSVAEIAEFEALESMNGAEHYFNHILFNPDGSRFMFIHLWVKDRKRYGRLITCDINGEDKYALINEGHTSHYTWKSNDELLVYSTHAASGTNYHLYRDRTDSIEVLGKGILDQDGHPSFLPGGDYLITDTYPDRLRNQKLLAYDLRKKALTCVSSFFSPCKFAGETRCDLHPRLSPDGKFVCLDAVLRDKRAMYLIDISQQFN